MSKPQLVQITFHDQIIWLKSKLSRSNLQNNVPNQNPDFSAYTSISHLHDEQIDKQNNKRPKRIRGNFLNHLANSS